MSLNIEQESNYQGDDWWKWAVWIDGPTSELDDVVEVEYKLHPSFPRPVRIVSDRGFQVSAANPWLGCIPDPGNNPKKERRRTYP